MDINYLHTDEVIFELQSRGIIPGSTQAERRIQLRDVLREIKTCPDKFPQCFHLSVSENLSFVKDSLNSIQLLVAILDPKNPDQLVLKQFRTRLFFLRKRVSNLIASSEEEENNLVPILEAVRELEQKLLNVDESVLDENEIVIPNETLLSARNIPAVTSTPYATTKKYLIPDNSLSALKDISAPSHFLPSDSFGIYKPMEPNFSAKPNKSVRFEEQNCSSSNVNVGSLIDLPIVPERNMFQNSQLFDGTLSSAKSMPVFKWNVQFSGEAGKESVTAFLEKIEELRAARNVSFTELFNSASLLFAGHALLWFRSVRERVANWSELVQELKKDFLPTDYDHNLLLEILSRTQGVSENVLVYILSVEALFRKLSTPYSEDYILKQIIRNLNPYFSEKLALHDIISIEHLKIICRKLQDSKVRIEKYKPPPTKKSNLLEPEMACLAVSDTRAKTTSLIPSTSRKVTSDSFESRAKKCWNCSGFGHLSFTCPRPKSLHCYGCGKKGVVRSQCDNCSPNRLSGNELSDSTRDAAAALTPNSPSQTNRSTGAIPKSTNRQ